MSDQTPPWEHPSASVKRPSRSVKAGRSDRASLARANGALSPERTALVRALLAEGKGRNAIARETGVSQGAVSQIAREIGHDFIGARATAVATQAAQMDARQVRRELADLTARHALDEERRREELAGGDTRARADVSRSVAAMTRAVVDLDRLDIERQRAEAERNAGADLDAYLEFMAGGNGTDGAADVIDLDARRGGEPQ